MAVDYEFTQGNTRPFFAIIVKNRLSNDAVDLTGTTIVFSFKEQGAKTAKVSGGSVTLTDAANGKCEYRWASSDLDVPGTYDAEFRITHTDSKVQSILIRGVRVHRKLS